MGSDKVDGITNHRIRTVFTADNGHNIFLEVCSGAGPVTEKLSITHCFDTTVSSDENKSSMKGSLEGGRGYGVYPETFEGILKLVHDLGASKYDSVEVLDCMDDYDYKGENNTYISCDTFVRNRRRTRARNILLDQLYAAQKKKGIKYPLISVLAKEDMRMKIRTHFDKNDPEAQWYDVKY